MACAHLCNDINSGALPALLPFFVTYKGMDYTDVGGLLFASSFLASVIQPAFGYLADRTSRQWFMGVGIMMTGGFFGITGLLSGYWAIFAAVTFMGIGSSIFHPEAARLVNKISGTAKGRGMSIFSVGGNAGFGLGPLLAVGLIYLFGLEGTLFFAFLSFIMGLLMLLWAPRFVRMAGQNLRSRAGRCKRLEFLCQTYRRYYNAICRFSWSSWLSATVLHSDPARQSCHRFYYLIGTVDSWYSIDSHRRTYCRQDWLRQDA